MIEGDEEGGGGIGIEGRRASLLVRIGRSAGGSPPIRDPRYGRGSRRGKRNDSSPVR